MDGGHVGVAGQRVGVVRPAGPSGDDGEVAERVEHGPLLLVESGRVEAQRAGVVHGGTELLLGPGERTWRRHPPAHGGRAAHAGQAFQLVDLHPAPLLDHPVH